MHGTSVRNYRVTDTKARGIVFLFLLSFLLSKEVVISLYSCHFYSSSFLPPFPFARIFRETKGRSSTLINFHRLVLSLFLFLALARGRYLIERVTIPTNQAQIVCVARRNSRKYSRSPVPLLLSCFS